ncbi:MAG: hypothetical protein DRJ98_02000 [Thermoprotei archaeon]|nr:MAG: hypothetical protein DRJ98_02000 [Thermoprotei archaeon]RLF18759.1 MAG: hypothetical protein DRN06_00550 [Thermoprotei archaeon]
MYDVVVVGAGPAGSSTALSASKRGLKVLLLEEHREVGLPLHCAGIIHPPSFERSGLKVPEEVVESRIRRVCVFTGYGQPLTEPFRLGLLVVNRARFDKWLVRLAVEAGAELKLQNRLMSAERAEDGWRLSIKAPQGYVNEECKLLVAADGVGSTTIRLVGFPARKELASCLQYELEGVELEDPERIDLYFTSFIAPGGYAWVIPLEGGKRLRVGLGVRKAEKPAKYYLDLFVRRLFSEGRVVKVYGGCVPVGGPVKPSYADGFLVVGDAAGHVNPLTGAGIVGAVRCGLIAGEVAASKLSRPKAEELKVYEDKCDEAVGKGYRRVLRARADLEKLSSAEIKAFIDREGLIEDLRRRRYFRAFLKVLLKKPSLAFTAVRIFRIRDAILT